jgi:hypothetical protein
LDIPSNGAITDSASKPVLAPIHIDSSLLHINSVPMPHVDSANSNPPGKKPKGVKGITSDDYKISVSKDSAKN